MIFNLMKHCFLFFLMFLTFSSCSEFLKGKPAKQETMEIKSEELSCLKEMSAQFKKIIRAESNESEIEDTFKCLDQTLSQFQSRVEGRSRADSFTAEELYIIFSKFHKSAEVSREAAKDLLVLKKALLGGSEEIITKLEISDLKSYLIVIKQEIQKLVPYMKLYGFKKENGPFSKQKIDSAFSQLRISLKVLLTASKMGKSEYEFQDLKRLLVSLNVLQDDQKELIDLAEKVKILLVGTDPLKNTEEYELAISNFTEVMALYSYVLYGDVQFEIKNQQQFGKVVGFVEQFVSVLMGSVQFKNKSQIQIAAVDPVIESVLEKQKDLFPFKVENETFKSFYKKLIIKVFSDQKSLSIDGLDAIKKVHLRSVQKEIAIYKLYLNFINSNEFQTEFERQNIKDLQLKLKKYDVKKDAQVLSQFTTEEQQFILSGFEDLKAEFLSPRPVVYRNKKMIIALNQEIWNQSWEDLARALYGKMLGRELIRGWGGSKGIVTEQGLIEWYTDFKQFAVEAKAFDPRSESIKTGQETFLQANLFTYAGNGDKEINQTEAFQYVSMLISGGNQSFTELREGLKAAGCNLSQNDAFDYPWNDEVCFYRSFKANYKNYFSNLSYLTGYLDKLSDVEFKNYYDSLMVVARRDVKEKGRIESADLRTLSMTLYYIESLFAVYDQNLNWTFSPSEVRTSYPRFENFVTDYANKNAKEELDKWENGVLGINPCRALYPLPAFIKEAFIFMAYNGRLPKEEDLNNPRDVGNIYECGKYQLGLSSSYQPFTFKGEIDRKTIINTFKVLKSALDSK